jgi:hypothetical protein
VDSTSEWARFLTLNLVQGDIQETLHPNYFGQLALGRCLSLAVNRAPGRGACQPTAGQGPSGMVYGPLPTAMERMARNAARAAR